MHCVNGKDIYPDANTALVVRDALISRYGRPTLIYKCHLCSMWHLTTWKSYPNMGRNVAKRHLQWNNLVQPEQRRLYDEQVKESANRTDAGSCQERARASEGADPI